MMYDVQVWQHGGWATDTVTGSKRRAHDRAHDIGPLARVINTQGLEVEPR